MLDLMHSDSAFLTPVTKLLPNALIALVFISENSKGSLPPISPKKMSPMWQLTLFTGLHKNRTSGFESTSIKELSQVVESGVVQQALSELPSLQTSCSVDHLPKKNYYPFASTVRQSLVKQDMRIISLRHS